jgi:hypothetical protein
MLRKRHRADRGHALLDALLSILLGTISIAAAFSAFQNSITLLSVQGPSRALLCKKVRCESNTGKSASRIIRCTCSSHKSQQMWEVIR